MIDLFKLSVLIVYLLLLFGLVAAIIFNCQVRDAFIKVHGSKTDKFSWVRYASSFVLITSIGITIHQATYSEVSVELSALLVGIAFAGKVTQSGINKDK